MLDFEELADHACMHPDDTKSVLLSALNQRTLEHLQMCLEAAETQDATYYSTAEQLEVIP